MDPFDPDRDLDDPELSAALRRHAERVTGPIDTETALADVTRRGQAQRRWRLTAGLGTAAAAVILIGGFVATRGDDREVLRAPATEPTTVTTPAPTTTTTPPQQPSTTAVTVAPSTTVIAAAPSTTTAVVATAPTTTAGVVPAPPVVTAPTIAPAPPTTPTTSTAPPTTTETYNSDGGSITVRLADGQISLVGQPAAVAGWTTRIDDNGPDRVRVRFELDNQYAEIRVDLIDGQLVERITNP